MKPSNSEYRLNEEMREARAIPGVFRKAFVGMLACLFVEVVAYYFLRVIGYTALLSNLGAVFLRASVLVALLHLSCLAIATCVARMLVDAVMSQQMSSRKQSMMLVAVSVLLATCALLEIGLVLLVGSSSISEAATVAMDTSSQAFDLSVALSLAIAAIVNFCMSYIVKYCSFLQWFYDETV